jgi:magnesium-transporting ATPase (P-type)
VVSGDVDVRPSETTTDEGPSWHALPAEETVALLESSPTAGLASETAAARLERHGPNEFGQDQPRRASLILLAQFKSPLIYILLVALVVTIAIAEYTDAGVIGAVLVINAVIGFVQERKADRSVHALMELAAPRSLVIRDAREQDIPSAELVPGDLVLLTSGTRVPADLRLVRVTSLEVDESLLTGESSPVGKTDSPVDPSVQVTDRSSMAFMGSVVASGRGRGIVVATGLRTELGGIAESIREQEPPPTPLQQRMRRFANVIAAVVLASTVVAFAVGLALGEPVDEMFLTAVALAVAVVPEGLPVAFTVAMALGVHRMAQRNAIVRSLPAVETLGSTDTIGSDKTGTLTTNRMTARRAWTLEGSVEFGPPHDDGPGPAIEAADRHHEARPDGALHDVLSTALLANEAEAVHPDEGTRRGDPTEVALLEAAWRSGLDPVHHRAEAPVMTSVPFESALRYSYVVVDEDGPVLRLKGAPERVLELCATMRADGLDRPLDRQLVLDAAEELADGGLRVLATAERRLDAPVERDDRRAAPDPTDLTLTGLVGLQDPARPGARAAIDRCRQAGIRVVMITGDHAATACAIAKDLGLGEEPVTAVTGVELESMDDRELQRAVHEADVFARVSPDHKLRIVHALRANDQVVAVTGDGVNDGPALRAADIGVAMGLGGTDVAREASDIVLTDDDFVSIANAVEEGRVVFDNVRKVTYFLLSTGVAAIVAILTSLAAGLPLPYVPAALLWLNVVTNGVQDVALAFDPGEPDALDRPPRRRGEGIVDRVLWERTVLTGVTMAVGSLWLLIWAMDAGLSAAEQRGAALTTLVIAMAAHVYNARSERRSIVTTHVRGNLFLLVSTLVALAIHLGASYWAPTQAVLQIEPVTAPGWARIGVVAVAVVLVSELHKWLRSRH